MPRVTVQGKQLDFTNNVWGKCMENASDIYPIYLSSDLNEDEEPKEGAQPIAHARSAWMVKPIGRSPFQSSMLFSPSSAPLRTSQSHAKFSRTLFR